MIKQLNEDMIDINEIDEQPSSHRVNSYLMSVVNKQKITDFFLSEGAISTTEKECLDRFQMCMILGAIFCNKTNCYGDVLERTLFDIIDIYVKYEKFQLIDVEYSPMNYLFSTERIREPCTDYVDPYRSKDEVKEIYSFMYEANQFDHYNVMQLGCYIVDFKLNDVEQHCAVCFNKASDNNLAPIIKNITHEMYLKYKETINNIIKEKPYLSGKSCEPYNESLFMCH